MLIKLSLHSPELHDVLDDVDFVDVGLPTLFHDPFTPVWLQTPAETELGKSILD